MTEENKNPGQNGGTQHQETHADAKTPAADSIWQKAKRGEVLEHVAQQDTIDYKRFRADAEHAVDDATKKGYAERAEAARERAKAPKLEAFGKELGKGERLAASVAGNWHHSGNMGKIAMVGGTVVGVGSVISGAKNILSPVRDENGQRKGSVFKEVAKVVGGALVTYLSAIRGGNIKAMGLGR